MCVRVWDFNLELLLKVLPQRSHTTSFLWEVDLLDERDVLDTELERELDFEVTVRRSGRSASARSELERRLRFVNKDETGLKTLLEIFEDVDAVGFVTDAFSLLSIPMRKLSSEWEEE